MANSAIQLPAPSAGQQFLSQRNKIMNGQFAVWQRRLALAAPAGPVVGSIGFASDRWRWEVDTDGGSFNPLDLGMAIGTFLPGEPKSLDIESYPPFFMRFEATLLGSSGNAASQLVQRIEAVETYNGGKATLSFWARTEAGTGTIGISLQQFFGTTGSAPVTIPASVDVALTTTWTRYVITFDVPSILGKTVSGGGPNDSLRVRFHNHIDAAIATLFGFVGPIAFTGILNLTNVQLEIGPISSSFERPDFATLFNQLNRYYNQSSPTGIDPAVSPTTSGAIGLVLNAGLKDGGNIQYPQEMRDVPSIAVFGATTGAPGVAEGPIGPSVIPLSLSNSGSTGFEYSNLVNVVVPVDNTAFHYTADAEL